MLYITSLSTLLKPECFTKPGTTDTCVCPLSTLNTKLPAVCHDKRSVQKITCREENNTCKCPMPHDNEVYQIECKEATPGKSMLFDSKY